MPSLRPLPTVLMDNRHGAWEVLRDVISTRLIPQVDRKGVVVFCPRPLPLPKDGHMVSFHDVWVRARPYPERFPQLAYVIAGHGEMILGDQWLSVPAGLGVFVPAGVPQAPHAMRGDRIQMSDWLRILVYPFGVIVHRCRLVPTAHEKSIRYFIPDTTLSALFNAWARGVQTPSANDLRDKSLLCAFLCLLAEATPVPVNPMEALPNDFATLPPPLQKALLALHSGFNQAFRLTALAQRCFVSPYYLCHLFRQHLQTTPLEYLVRLRLTIARQLLEQVGLSIGDVAVLVGYQDWRHFHRLFVRHFGVPPSAVRSHKDALSHRIFKPPR
ncbi:Bifunctional transcriptional activator/DNA repair enzyme AdaA [bacterium HR17]|uniref:Bifunctional transcriptional activator/DNA repair enzyme AdaA n=1 Tax=Candidatus Fervidibacter japonicus TaxID=2035412 RepID=A0A2H5XBH8_9BACT|nr:Bifunctional transcriptional activator/DNA repair enzyme AdaA [bacterium HR17]